MNFIDKGKAWVFGDDINTDYIISSKRKRDTLDTEILSRYMMEDIRPGFGEIFKRGDFIIGGRNFGCGSAMEIAAAVIKGAGTAAVIAESFSRTFYRNGINGGIYLFECDTSRIREGDLISVLQNDNFIKIVNHNRNEEYEAKGPSGLLDSIISCGGLIPFLRKNNGFPQNSIQ